MVTTVLYCYYSGDNLDRDKLYHIVQKYHMDNLYNTIKINNLSMLMQIHVVIVPVQSLYKLAFTSIMITMMEVKFCNQIILL